MIADPGSIAVNAVAEGAAPCLKVEINWASTTWTDESGYFLTGNGQSQIMDPVDGLLSLGTARIATATLTMRNNDSRFSEGKAGSQAATNGLQGKGVRISAGYAGEYVRIFTGKIMDPQEQEIAETVTLTCHDLGSDPKRQTLSSAVGANFTTDDWIDYLRTQLSITPVDLEYGLLIIPWVWIDDDDALQEMRTAAASEAGCLFFDVNGTLTFWNAAHWADATHVDHLTTSTFAELAPDRDYVNRYNIVACPYVPRREHHEDKVYSLKRTIAIPPNSSRTEVLNFQWPLVAFTEYKVAVTTSGGKDLTSDVTLDNATPTAGQRWEIVFTNANLYHEAYVTQFDVYGRALDGRQAETYVKDATGSATDRRHDIPRNVYVQSEDHARFLADLLADRLSTGRLYATATDLRANPLWELGDILEVTAALTGMASDFITTGVKWSVTDAYTMGLSMLKADLYPYTGYWVVGTSPIGAAAGGRVIY